jgi:hypothetical protein
MMEEKVNERKRNEYGKKQGTEMDKGRERKY